MSSHSLKLQPLPYQGSKRALAPRIASFFPDKIKTLYEPFAGSAAVTLYAAANNLAQRFVIGDLYIPIAKLWELIIDDPEYVIDRYSEVWSRQFNTINHFNEVRAEFNDTSEPVLFLYLAARCVKNAIRFNSLGKFSQSVDRRRNGTRPERLAQSVRLASVLLKGRTVVFSGPATQCLRSTQCEDIVYLDPPYAGTTYGADKRYASGMAREALIVMLKDLDARQIPYILSYDGSTGLKKYSDPLPKDVQAEHHLLDAGRSSQATIVGRNERTIESLYVSKKLFGHRSVRSFVSQEVLL